MSTAGHFLIVEARFYEDIADALLAGATARLEAAGASFDRVSVPGAFEIPAAIAFAVNSNKAYDGYIALGCVIRGQTTHYSYICNESARGLQDLAIRHGLAIGYGILTVENQEQAWLRADRSHGDKGGGAAKTAMDMLAVKRRFQQ